jgi:hypothetical protein
VQIQYVLICNCAVNSGCPLLNSRNFLFLLLGHPPPICVPKSCVRSASTQGKVLHITTSLLLYSLISQRNVQCYESTAVLWQTGGVTCVAKAASAAKHLCNTNSTNWNGCQFSRCTQNKESKYICTLCFDLPLCCELSAPSAQQLFLLLGPTVGPPTTCMRA